MANEFHKPVLLKECIDGLAIIRDGVYVDATFGGGGHSKEILKHLENGILIAFDSDSDAWKNKINDKRFIQVQENFRNLNHELHKRGIEKIDGLLADLGVSSHQFDTAARGFSTRYNSDLDMRMDNRRAVTAKEILNESEPGELKRIFKEYGELDNSSQIVRKIINNRNKKSLETVFELKEMLAGFTHSGNENRFYARVFQALRIAVNDEINALKELLIQSAELLKSGGRLAVISYHSLEDRLAKNFIRSGKFEGDPDKDFYGNKIVPFTAVNKKPIIPTEAEINKNPRARSAKLRIAEKN